MILANKDFMQTKDHNNKEASDSDNIGNSKLAKEIAGEIVLSKNPSEVIQKWRTIFKISQRDLASQMNLMPSVISDYESGRRKSPGVGMIRKIVDSLLKIDESQGKIVTKQFNSLYSGEIVTDAVLDIRETKKPRTIEDIAGYVNGEIILCEDSWKRQIFGYTIIDSLKAILDLSPKELVKLYGMTTERALIFTKVERGRSPMIAIKVTDLRPGVVVLHGVKELDKIALRISKVEKIPLIVSKYETIDELIKNLRENIVD